METLSGASAATFEHLATACMLLKCVESDIDFRHEADKMLAEIPAGEFDQAREYRNKGMQP